VKSFLAVVFALLLVAGSANGQDDLPEAELIQWTSSVGHTLHKYYSLLEVAVAAVEAEGGTLPNLHAGGNI
jgi:hypothetical protein